MGLGHSIRIGNMPRILDIKRQLHIIKSVVFDSEIQDLDNQEAFLDIWRLMNKKSTEAELTRNTSQGGYAHANLIRARASLLLADYVAGIVMRLTVRQIRCQIAKSLHQHLSAYLPA